MVWIKWINNLIGDKGNGTSCSIIGSGEKYGGMVPKARMDIQILLQN